MKGRAPGTVKGRARGVALTLSVLLAAMTGCPADPVASDPEPAPEATWHGGVRAVLGEHCAPCHTSNGIGPFPLDDLDEARYWASAALASAQAGRMPPWPPDPDCRPYEGERLMPAEDLALFAQWVDDEMPLGDPERDVAPPPRSDPIAELGPPTVVVGPEGGYSPNPDLVDDYRCFVLDHTFTADRYLRMMDVDPGATAIVHHVIVYRVPGEHAEAFEALDAAEPGPGYTCFGSAGVGVPDNLGGWTPGLQPIPYPDGVAQRIPAGSRLVMQVHYNRAGGVKHDPGTFARLWLTGEEPVYLVDVHPVADLAIRIPPGEPESVHSQRFYNTTGEPWVVFAVAAHMHLLGQSIRMTAIHSPPDDQSASDDQSAAEPDEQCLIDIPRWDYAWQEVYPFRAGDLVVISPGDAVELTCTFDNSVEAQPTALGHDGVPREVFWGDGSFDEMCLGFLVTLRPFEPLPDAATECPGFDTCHRKCVDTGGGLAACALACPEDPDLLSTCGPCMLGALVDCLAATCATEAGEVIACVNDCYAPGVNTATCLTTDCQPTYGALDPCIADADWCTGTTAACGVDLSP